MSDALMSRRYSLPIRVITPHPSQSTYYAFIFFLIMIWIFFIPLTSESQGLSDHTQLSSDTPLFRKDFPAVTSSPVEISSQELSIQRDIYTLKGNIKIIKTTEPALSIQAEEGWYNSTNGVAELKGNLHYEDNELSINASRAILNLKLRTGVLYDAEIVFKKEYLRIITPEVQKLSEDHFVFKKATFTTCEGVPDWCIKGRDVDFIRGERISARDATFNIKGFPVFYTPYIWAPALTERKTGFLIPSISYSNRLGPEFKIPFYIVLGEHADTTLLLDLYTERGAGKALEFRHRGLPGNYLDLWAYHIRDSRLDKDFYEISLKQNMENYITASDGDIPAVPYFREFISLHTATEDFFNNYNPLREARLTRFLSSASEISYRPRNNIRFFLTAEYWQDLQDSTSLVSQRLPEMGMSLYPSGEENLYYFFEARAGNFFREEGLKGKRIWFMPGVLHSTGKNIVFSQSLSLNGSYYFLSSGSSNIPTKEQEEGFLSEIIYAPRLSTRLEKDYDSFQHVIEPSIGYLRKERLTSHKGLLKEVSTEDFFDYRDILERSSKIEIELLNRFKFVSNAPEGRSGELIIRLSQPYDTFKSHLLPLTGEASFRTKIYHAALESEYEPDEGSLKTLTLRTGVDLKRFRVWIAERYSEDLDLFFLSSNILYEVSRNLSLNSTVWYDLRGEGLRNLLIGTSWKRQCWTLNLRYIKTPEDYSILASIDLRGL